MHWVITKLYIYRVLLRQDSKILYRLWSKPCCQLYQCKPVGLNGPLHVFKSMGNMSALHILKQRHSYRSLNMDSVFLGSAINEK